MADEKLDQLHKEVNSLAQAQALSNQRMDTQDARIERLFSHIAEVRGETRAETENLREAITRLFDRLASVEKGVSEIDGGIKTLRWLIPLNMTFAVGVVVPLMLWLLNTFGG